MNKEVYVQSFEESYNPVSEAVKLVLDNSVKPINKSLNPQRRC